ncbi:hypothetical protein [uncultured Roseobacter sp.]|uniref:hypothetical protein n=1 Tax=uncultured Roseobacter sp. TaxID=114847 RepID=UPI002605950B|nr:hypothetical protein [uncultured Roseobacter sp.]
MAWDASDHEVHAAQMTHSSSPQTPKTTKVQANAASPSLRQRPGIRHLNEIKVIAQTSAPTSKAFLRERAHCRHSFLIA